MATRYHLYSNGGAGPVDYTAPLADTAALAVVTAPLNPSSTYLFAVRAYDTVSGLEERNVDAVVEVVSDAAGVDVSGVPRPPAGLTASPAAGAAVELSWSYPDSGGASRTGRAPAGFKVCRGTGGVVDYSAPVATVPYVPVSPHYRHRDSGLTDGTAYAYGVRAYNAFGTEANTLTATAVADGTAPGDVDGLAAGAV